MMSLVREYLGSIAGVHIFAIISMMIFLLTFLVVIYYTYTTRKEDLNDYSRLPLDEDEPIKENE